MYKYFGFRLALMVTGKVDVAKDWICSILVRFYFQELLKFLLKHSLKCSSPLLLEKLAFLSNSWAGLVQRSSSFRHPVIFFFDNGDCLSSIAPTLSRAVCPQPQNMLPGKLCSGT